MLKFFTPKTQNNTTIKTNIKYHNFTTKNKQMVHNKHKKQNTNLNIKKTKRELNKNLKNTISKKLSINKTNNSIHNTTTLKKQFNTNTANKKKYLKLKNKTNLYITNTTLYKPKSTNTKTKIHKTTQYHKNNIKKIFTKTNIVPLVWKSCSIVALVGILYGMDIGVISGVLPFITKEFNLSTNMAGCIVGSMMGGASIGALANCIISQHLGRKKSLLVSSILFCVGAVIAVFAKYTLILIIARIIIGLSVGSASFTAPLYLAEITPKKIRGMTISLYQFMVTIGTLIAFISNLIFSYLQSWRSMFGILIIPSFLLFCGLLLIPDSPRWLASTNNKRDAIKILNQIRFSNFEVNKEIKEIFNSIHFKNKSFGWNLFKQNINFRRSVILGIILQIIQQFTGMNVMMYFSPKIFELSGFIGTKNQLLSTLLVGLVNVLATIVAIILVDKLGRKPILYIGFTIMAIGMAILSLVLYIGHLHVTHYLSIFSLLLFVAGFAMSAGPIIWLICAEIQPLYGRDFGISCSTIANWLANMLLGTFFLTILSILGGPLTFSLLALANISFIIFTIFVIPETKGISLEQIEKNLMNGKPLRKLGK